MAEEPSLYQIVNVLETLYPLRYAEEWDEPGLIVGDPAWSVSRIYCAVDPTSEIVDEAIAHGASLLITHHPLFFRSVHEVSGLGFRGDIVNRLVEHHCALWVGHTNADSAHRGTAHAFADRLGLVDQRPLVPIHDDRSEFSVGLGRVGSLPEPTTLRELATRVARLLPETSLGIQVAGDPDEPVRLVATLPGSGDSLFDEVRASGADVYITSDLRHHPATDAWQQAKYETRLRAQGFAVGHGDATPRPALINTPHSAIERSLFHYLVGDVRDAIANRLGVTIPVELSQTNTDPWTFRMG
ncbi:Nif3-like dinuclear metal center hexameric protein [Bifidobacterium sp. 82T24]|uniref:Nif3-like dinuclear metal center hexameric protein n=1 Tax=Bifidobacterium pluvialisilvae TaxID=2834436 RepID=UPI001C57F74C|nr:Nif3-like dinuclear metal center hexameric protein [Bifidobacterium pluvialisilvae]MBW3087910.1 Nif3-like dinuclear metal center hexameric protein [Bifidobacterium pluvialisilvae]